MIKAWWGGFLLLLLMAIMGFYLQFPPSLTLPCRSAQQMGMQIWKNECAGKRSGLTAWNVGEEFASMGIGHFIWYPEGKQGVFKETFPSLLSFFRQQGVEVPSWLQESKGCPWRTREEFQRAQLEAPMEQLRQLLIDNVDLQIYFMVERLERALPILLSQLPLHRQKHVTFQFYRLAHTSEGIYVLLDYLNFKGEGVAYHECYQGQGWGLLQVLECMEGSEPGRQAIEEFIQKARHILARRVQNAPPERQEQRWLKGWYNRLDSYLHFSLSPAIERTT